MRTRLLCSLAGLSFVILSACTSAIPPVSVVKVGSEGVPQNVEGDAIKIRRPGQEPFDGMKKGYHVVRNEEDWKASIKKATDPKLPEALDTTRFMLLAVVAEDKDATELKVDHAVETGDLIHVWVKETRAGEKCPLKADGQPRPYDAITVPRSEKSVRFYVEEQQAEGCGEGPSATVKCRVGAAPAWSDKPAAQPGDVVDCELTSETRGKFAIIDQALRFSALPGGSLAKLSYEKGSTRGKFDVDVFGTYALTGEVSDEQGRHGTSTIKVEVKPPKTKDALVQLVWTNFDASDDPETFPRVRLRALEGGAKGKECSVDAPKLAGCEVQKHSAYTQMKIAAASMKLPLSVQYLDDRVERGPLVCVHVYFDGDRTVETCDRAARTANDRWDVGTLDMATGKVEGGTGSAPPPPKDAKPADSAKPADAEAPPPKPATKPKP